MKLSFSLLPLLALIPISTAVGPSYFYITRPAAGDQWTQGDPHAATWIHANDDINIVDVELARMSTSGLLLAAREVPTRWGSLNLEFGSVPPGDDYYLVFLNVTHGEVYSISEKFTILAASSSSANSTAQVAPVANKPTVTVIGTPGPLMTFAQTFGVDASSAVDLQVSKSTMMLISIFTTAFLGGTMLLL